MRFGLGDDSRDRSPWLRVARVCGALLLLPLLAWLVLGGRLGTAVRSPPPSLAVPPPAALTAPPTPPEPPGGPTPATRHVARAVAPAGSITGTVLDPTGTPTADASVTCNLDPTLSAISDARGHFEMALLAASCEAHATHALFGPSEPIWLGVGSDNVLRLTASGGVSGVVVDEHGAPVSSYLLSIDSFVASAERDAPPQLGRVLKVADSAGAFLWQGLMPGRYVLSASAPGRPPALSGKLAVETGQTTTGARIVLRAGAKLTGKVTDGDTRGLIEGATVSLEGASWSGASGVAESKTDASGAYTLDGVPPGPFSVGVVREGYRTRVVSGLVTRGASELKEDIAIRRGDGGASEIEVTGVGLHLRPAPEGIVVMMLLPGGPAERGGVKRGDLLLRIDGASTEGLSVNECTQRIACREGAQLRLSVLRAAAQVELTLPCERIVR